MSSPKVCPTSHELSCAFPEGASAALRKHMTECASCTLAWQDWTTLRELGQSLPTAIPNEERMARIQAQMRASLGSAPTTPTSRVAKRARAFKGEALFAAMLACAVLVYTSQHNNGRSTTERKAARGTTPLASPVQRGVVFPHGGAHFVRLGSQPDEIIRLIDGKVSVQVSPLLKGERFRVVTADGEVEVKGTAFDVSSAADRMLEVYVLHGLVEVRLRHGGSHWLRAGQRWEVPAPAAAAAPPSRRDEKKEPRSSADKRVEPAKVASDVAASEAERTFSEGFAALREGKPMEAAVAFERSLRADSQASIAEDAAFWHAVALMRAGRTSGAAQAFAMFLNQHRASPRNGQASALLGSLLLEDGDLEGARLHFRAAEMDPAAEIAARARAGLAEIERRKERATAAPTAGAH